MPRKRDTRRLKHIHLQTSRGKVTFDVDPTGHLLNRPPRRGMAEIDKAPLPPPPPMIPSRTAPSSDAVHLTHPFASITVDLESLSTIFDTINPDTFNLLGTSIDAPMPDVGDMSRATAWDHNLFDLPWEPEKTFRNQAPDQEAYPLGFSF
jgi:hypothetical protein